VGTLGCSVLLLESIRDKSLAIPKWLVIAVVTALALFVRLAFSWRGVLLSFDPYWYGDYINFMEHGIRPYSGFFFPYPVAFADFLSLVRYIGSSATVLRVAMSVIDALNAALIASIVGSTSLWRGLTAGVSYALLPVTVLESGRNGHFEALVSLSLIVVILAMRTGRSGVAAAFVTLAVFLKLFPLADVPLAIAACSSIRKAWIAIGAALATLLLLVLPYGREALAMLRGLFSQVGAAKGQASAFAQNSIPALVADFHGPQYLTIVGKMIALFAIISLTVYALHYRQRFTDGRNCKKRASLCPMVVRRIAKLVVIAVLVEFCGLAVHLICQPWLSSQFSYPWWTPPSIEIARGVCLAVLSSVLIGAVWRCRSFDKTSTAAVAWLAAFAMLAVIVVHPNVYGWYYIAPISLLFLTGPNSLLPLIVLQLSVAYFPYNAATFAHTGLGVTIARPIRTIQIPAGNGHYAYEAMRKAVPGNGSFIRVSSENASEMEIRFTVPYLKTRHISPNVRAMSIFDARPMSSDAVAFNVLGDSDPTFGDHPVIWSVDAIGRGARGEYVKVPLISKERSQTNIGPVRYAISEQRFDGRLAELTGVLFEAHLDKKARKTHVLIIRNVRLINTDRLNVTDIALVIVIGSVFSIVAIGGLLARRLYEDSYTTPHSKWCGRSR